ncbi:GNAT family N-acetyltransferase [Thalassotalea ponticola]|uniref:GNAT family N-acetyltransferase n=1 Tax=Thalassotalea ponticola TaxID=1523392 RepID=UPI0025B4FF7E|nr:GNAT family N-acetyltransferase [Thalassotalea ponticola]MDN3651307.1 GNAT family N-acetyltransferase [Thalassotalea ponticola]
MTTEINWQAKTFDQLSTNTLYDLLKLRVDIFVVEQTCYYPELDDADRVANTIHLLGYDGASLVAYLRILPKGVSYDDCISIGRVAVAQSHRGQRIGRDLMEQALSLCDVHFAGQPLKISAQHYLEAFYQSLGFSSVSDVYLEDGIPHIAMLKQPTK